MIRDTNKNRIHNSSLNTWIKTLLLTALLVALIVGILYSIRLSRPQNMTELREYSARRYAETSIPEHRFKYVQIGNRIAEYCDVKGLRQEELEDFLKEPYSDGVYHVKGENNFKYLILREESGALTPVEFCFFEVTDDLYKQEHFKKTAFGTNAQHTVIFSPYTYAEAAKEIYSMYGPEDIVRITVTPRTENNTPELAAIKKEIGSRNITEREAIETFYNVISRATCLGGSDKNPYYNMQNRFSYSFSPERKDGKRTDEDVTEEELTRAVRYLTIRLKDGTVLDRWKYDAVKGCFFEYGGVVTEPLDDADVYALNAIFGIE